MSGCEEAQIPRFYAGRAIFITGGTGFLGKVLIERILSTCPDVGPIHVLVRQKRERGADARLLDMKQSKVFDVVRERCPQQLDKLRLVAGDVTRPALGIDAQGLQQLQEVSVVFHVAATLKFSEPLARAVSFNVRPVIALMDLCDNLPHMEVLIHVSTAYSYADLPHIEEKVYPPPRPLRALLALTDELDEDTLAELTPRYISPKPNTYTFTKAMAEHVVATHQRRGYLAAICRPTIVICTRALPFPGWVDNFAGPAGVAAAAGTGLLHVMRGRRAARPDLLPADTAAHALLAAAWQLARDRPSAVAVYNISTGASPVSWGQFEKALRRQLRREPFQAALWYPSGLQIQNKYLFRISEFLLHTLPLHLAAHVSKLLGIKMPLDLAGAARRMREMLDVLTFFSLREWRVDAARVRALHAAMTPADRALYPLDTDNIQWEPLFAHFVDGTRRHLLRERDDEIARARAHSRNRILAVVHYGAAAALLLLLLRLLLHSALLADLLRAALRLLRVALVGA